MTPSELKYLVENSGRAPYFFDRKSMGFFGDTMRNYGVCSATVETHDGERVEVWELYRRRPVKFGLKDSAYFNKATFERVHPKKD
jgi:hypothetical protein